MPALPISQSYARILKRELVPALGCTEPIAIALAAATAKKALGDVEIDSIRVHCSGNIIKNAKSVIVPTTGDLRGIDTSAILGAVAGDPALGLEVLSPVEQSHLDRTKAMLQAGLCTVELLDTPSRLHILVELEGGGHRALAEIRDAHSNVVRIERDGERLFSKAEATEADAPRDEAAEDMARLNLRDILTFARETSLTQLQPLLKRQAEYNYQIAQEGLRHPYGGSVGATLLRRYDAQDVHVRARALAAAGSDARMGGCVLPVIINSGSGNQGMTCSLPLIAYAQQLHCGEEAFYRALIVSDLSALLLKRGVGRLSAFCGAVCAACGAGAGITFLTGGSDQAVADTITNALANVSGIVCDGAKGSCAAKIASAVDAALLGHEMAMDGLCFGAGEGLVKQDIEATIAGVGRMAAQGMAQTDEKILELMLE